MKMQKGNKMINYNASMQYRCTIIRGKSISKMDDLLPVYAEILQEICPVSKKDFADFFDEKLSRFILDDKKTIKNHRTENAGKLLGMYFEKNGIIYISERTRQFLKDNDQPAFFKSVCFRFQQPNGSQKIQTIKDKINNSIKIKPYHFILKVLQIAANDNNILSKNEIAFYILNSLEVLQGKIKPETVYKQILNDRTKGINNKVENSDKAYSYSMQHINEQFDYLELANLIRKDKNYIWLNNSEKTAIDFFIQDLDTPLNFDIYNYDLTNKAEIKNLYLDWQEYFGEISKKEIKAFVTSIHSLDKKLAIHKKDKDVSTIELGDEGEIFVLNKEKEIVKLFNPRLVNKVNHHGKTKGLGYDITSIEAKRNIENPEFLRYIEVKSTKRVHPPNLEQTYDTLNFTRNEWIAAQQHLEHYYIYRVYFTSQGVFMKIIKNPFNKNQKGELYATPLMYRIEFNENAIDETYKYAVNE